MFKALKSMVFEDDGPKTPAPPAKVVNAALGTVPSAANATIVDNTSTAGRAKNRRVEVILKK